jgi:hypothetical protein
VGLRQISRVAALIILGLLVAGCVAPQYTYVTDSSDSAYFKVPPSWHEVNESTLHTAEGSANADGTYLWSRAYDAAAKPSVSDIDAPTQKPIALASVLSMSSTERNDVSFDGMRDLLLPVTAAARKAAADEHLSGFASLSDQVITDSHNDRGIHEIFNYDVGTSLETFDLTVMTNSTTTKLYFLLVQCSATCFVSNYKQIAAVTGSFTIGGGS